MRCKHGENPCYFIARGITYPAPIITFFEIVIWLLAIEVVMWDLSNKQTFWQLPPGLQ